MGQNSSDLVRFENITFIGVLHFRIEFAVLVNRYIRAEKPDCICVELPHALRNEISSALRQLPHHSVILYETAAKENSVLIIEGSDGVQEAARLALENDIPLRFIDPLPLRVPSVPRQSPRRLFNRFHRSKDVPGFVGRRREVIEKRLR